MRWWWCDDDDDEDDEDEEEEEEEEDRFVLDQHVELEFYGTSSFKQQSEGEYLAPLVHIILYTFFCTVFETNSNCLMWIWGLSLYFRHHIHQSSRCFHRIEHQYQIYKFWFYPTIVRSHDFPYSRRASSPLHHWCCYFKYIFIFSVYQCLDIIVDVQFCENSARIGGCDDVTTQKTKDWATRIPITTGFEIRCFERVKEKKKRFPV
jgi:hypothetical protein